MVGTQSAEFVSWTSVQSFSQVNGISTDQAAEALYEAEWVLWSLTGRRIHGPERRVDVYRNRPGVCVIDLVYGPVTTIHSVSRGTVVGAVPVEVDGWEQLYGGRVRICCASRMDAAGLCHVCRDEVVIVDYTIGSNLPPGIDRVVRRLALEFHRANIGGTCALPERITTVNRQGASWTVLDPLDFLDRGMTGIGPVDSWVAAVNGRGTVRLIDPLRQLTLLESVGTPVIT